MMNPWWCTSYFYILANSNNEIYWLQTEHDTKSKQKKNIFGQYDHVRIENGRELRYTSTSSSSSSSRLFFFFCFHSIFALLLLAESNRNRHTPTQKSAILINDFFSLLLSLDCKLHGFHWPLDHQATEIKTHSTRKEKKILHADTLTPFHFHDENVPSESFDSFSLFQWNFHFVHLISYFGFSIHFFDHKCIGRRASHIFFFRCAASTLNAFFL